MYRAVPLRYRPHPASSEYDQRDILLGLGDRPIDLQQTPLGGARLLSKTSSNSPGDHIQHSRGSPRPRFKPPWCHNCPYAWCHKPLDTDEILIYVCMKKWHSDHLLEWSQWSIHNYLTKKYLKLNESNKNKKDFKCLREISNENLGIIMIENVHKKRSYACNHCLSN